MMMTSQPVTDRCWAWGGSVVGQCASHLEQYGRARAQHRAIRWETTTKPPRTLTGGHEEKNQPTCPFILLHSPFPCHCLMLLRTAEGPMAEVHTGCGLRLIALLVRGSSHLEIAPLPNELERQGGLVLASIHGLFDT